MRGEAGKAASAVCARVSAGTIAKQTTLCRLNLARMVRTFSSRRRAFRARFPGLNAGNARAALGNASAIFRG